MYDKKFLNTLNHIIFDDNTIEEITNYIESGKLITPYDGIETQEGKRHKKRFIEKFSNFEMRNDKLVYVGSEDKVYEVIKPNEVEDLLKEIYSNPESAGLGIYKFYRKICGDYVGVQYKDVKKFLESQQYYQLTKPILKPTINKPIISSRPNERWAIDLIDMNRYIKSNRKYRYILTCIDYFTKFGFAEPLKNKTSNDVVRAMNNIVSRATGIPRILQKDNGGEFQGLLNDWLDEHKVKFVNTQSYSPQSNGLVENFNRQLRRIIRELFIRNKSLNWVDDLQTAVNSKNGMINETTQHTPNELYLKPLSQDNHNNVSERIQQNANKTLVQAPIFNVGDLVRIKMTALQSQIRQKIKHQDKKYIVVSYSPDIYVVASVISKDHPNENYRYTVKTLDDEPLLTQSQRNNPNRIRANKRFFGTDFIKANLEPNHLTKSETNKLNKIDDYTDEKKKPSVVKKVIYSKPKPKVVIDEQPRRTTRERRLPAYLNDYELN